MPGWRGLPSERRATRPIQSSPARGARLLVTIVPSEMQVYPDRFAKMLDLPPGESLQQAMEKPDERWNGLALALDVPS